MIVNKERRNLKIWGIIGVFVIFGLAVLWHYLYKWAPSGLIGSISPVNESPWEHTKLFFFPMLIYFAIGRSTVGKSFPNFLFAHTIILPLMPFVMLFLYYLSKTLGVDSVVVNLIITFVVIVLGVYLAYKATISKTKLSGPAYHIASFVIIIAMFFILVVFTYYPPMNPLFQDPNTLEYGIPQ